MESQTYPIFQAIGGRTSREGLDLLLALLDGPVGVDDVAGRTGIANATASRRLDDLALAGIIRRVRPRDPYELTEPELTRRFLEAATELGSAIASGRAAGEKQLKKRISKTRFTIENDNARRTP